MSSKRKIPSVSPLNPASISRFKKERFIKSLSEDDFRDKVVRPLFLRRGFTDGRELCGIEEEGKDTVFVDQNKLDMQQIWAIQTKRGNINLSSKASQNTVTAATQLKTALETKILFTLTKKKVKPNYAVLCASGKINRAAQRYICNQVNDPRIVFMDIDDIIPMVDEYYPEFWWGIDADRFPYLKNLRDALIKSSDTITISELDVKINSAAPITDDMYVPLYLHRLTTKRLKKKGQVYTQPDLEQIPVRGVLGRSESLIYIVGEAGTGKTTALRRFAYMIAEKSLSDTQVETIPIILKCTEIEETEASILDLIASVTIKYSNSNKPCFSEEDLSSGNLLILADALDEVADNRRKYVIAKLQDFHSKYKNCKIIITSRNYASIINMPELNSFIRFTLTPIDLKQAQKLLERLIKGKALPVEKASEVLRRLNEVHGMELNPLLVTIFVATSDYSRRDIPANITELFKKFTEMMLGRWDLKKGLSQQYQTVVKDFLLKRLAFSMHSNKQTLVPLDYCKEVFRQNLTERGYEADLEIMFEEIIHRSGLFIIEGETIRFKHILIQEFFAGRGVPSPEFFQGVITDDWWKNALVFYFGEHPDAHPDLYRLTENISSYEGINLYKAAVAIGLAIQACYLAKVSEKMESMTWVMKSLAASEDRYLSQLQDQNPEFPLTAFLSYYIYARDSVACEQIKNHIFESIEVTNGSKTPLLEVEIFWRLVSLIESGNLSGAEIMIKKFKPSDQRLLLALHLGCFLIANLRITSKEEKKSALKICNLLDPKIAHLRKQVMDEFKSMLIEARRGKLEVISTEKKDTKKIKAITGTIKK